jgi:hypothetical protein
MFYESVKGSKGAQRGFRRIRSVSHVLLGWREGEENKQGEEVSLLTGRGAMKRDRDHQKKHRTSGCVSWYNRDQNRKMASDDATGNTLPAVGVFESTRKSAG